MLTTRELGSSTMKLLQELSGSWRARVLPPANTMGLAEWCSLTNSTSVMMPSPGKRHPQDIFPLKIPLRRRDIGQVGSALVVARKIDGTERRSPRKNSMELTNSVDRRCNAIRKRSNSTSWFLTAKCWLRTRRDHLNRPRRGQPATHAPTWGARQPKAAFRGSLPLADLFCLRGVRDYDEFSAKNQPVSRRFV